MFGKHVLAEITGSLFSLQGHWSQTWSTTSRLDNYCGLSRGDQWFDSCLPCRILDGNVDIGDADCNCQGIRGCPFYHRVLQQDLCLDSANTIVKSKPIWQLWMRDNLTRSHTLLYSRETQVSRNIMFSSATQPRPPPPRHNLNKAIRDGRPRPPRHQVGWDIVRRECACQISWMIGWEMAEILHIEISWKHVSVTYDLDLWPKILKIFGSHRDITLWNFAKTRTNTQTHKQRASPNCDLGGFPQWRPWSTKFNGQGGSNGSLQTGVLIIKAKHIVYSE